MLLATLLISSALTCHSVASREGGLPEVCSTNAYRDELVAYMNLSEVYLLEADRPDSRFIDRVELVPDLGENSLTLGGGKAVLRLNSFLRIKDAKDLLTTLKTRLLLVKASAETNALMAELAVGKAPARVNLDAPLKTFLDAPFLGADGRILAPDPTSSSHHEGSVSAIATHPHGVDAMAPMDEACVTARKNALDQKLKLEKDIQQLSLARSLMLKATAQAPEPLPHDQLRGRPTELASAVAKSDCDACFEAVHHCKAGGLLKGFVPTEGNCRKVIATKNCVATLPPLARVPVEFCRGIAPSPILESWEKEQAVKEAELRQTMARLTADISESCESAPSTSL